MTINNGDIIYVFYQRETRNAQEKKIVVLDKPYLRLCVIFNKLIIKKLKIVKQII